MDMVHAASMFDHCALCRETSKVAGIQRLYSPGRLQSALGVLHNVYAWTTLERYYHLPISPSMLLAFE